MPNTEKDIFHMRWFEFQLLDDRWINVKILQKCVDRQNQFPLHIFSMIPFIDGALDSYRIFFDLRDKPEMGEISIFAKSFFMESNHKHGENGLSGA